MGQITVALIHPSIWQFSDAGTALIRVGQTEQALGQIERDYIRHAHDAMIGPLKRFLEGEMKNIAKERKILENKRLDLDSCKNKVRKARALQLQPVVHTRHFIYIYMRTYVLVPYLVPYSSDARFESLLPWSHCCSNNDGHDFFCPLVSDSIMWSLHRPWSERGRGSQDLA